ncbi:MAG: DEAD/DEAH box helicase [Candidatus Bathyarchaeia archaeon]
MIDIRYRKGSLLIRGDLGTPYAKWDPRAEAFRALPLHYSDIIEYLERSRVLYRDRADESLPMPPLNSKLELRPYQREALDAWLDAGRRGVIELPTGSGKTYIALKGIERINLATLVIVPTLDLVDQWRDELEEVYSIEVGVYGGGESILKPLTVSTYDSAYIRAEQIGNRFSFLVFDEVHHLPAPSYMQIAEMYTAPYRMGLTATYERPDGGHEELPRLVGGRVYRLDVDALTGQHLSPYTHERIYVDLTPKEREVYEQEYNVFTGYLERKGIPMRSQEDFKRFIMYTGGDPDAREALLARNRAVEIALNSSAKIEVLSDLLRAYNDEKTIIFTRHNDLVYRLSERFLIPAITHRTPKSERRRTLEEFRSGDYRVVVTSQVLDEGIDVPDASVAFIISGTGSSREYIQRLGRILRKRKGKTAKLFELVARDTVESRISWRRHR